MANTDTVQALVDGGKITSVWVAVGISSWNDAAAAAAAIYSVILICEWLWKKVLRPFGENHGWIERKSRRKYD